MFSHHVTLHVAIRESSFARSAQVDSEVDVIESVSTPLHELRPGLRKHLDFLVLVVNGRNTVMQCNIHDGCTRYPEVR